MDESLLGRLNIEYLDALMTGDVAWFEEHLAPEFVCIEADGSVRFRPEFLLQVAAGRRYAGYHVEHVQVRVYGEVALIQAAGRFTAENGEVRACRYTDIYVNRNRRWMVVSAQVTRIPVPATRRRTDALPGGTLSHGA